MGDVKMKISSLLLNVAAAKETFFDEMTIQTIYYIYNNQRRLCKSPAE